MTSKFEGGTILIPLYLDGKWVNIAEDEINPLIKLLRDKRNELNLEVVAPVSTVPEKVHSFDGPATVATFGDEGGRLSITISGTALLSDDATVVLDGRQETALTHILSERKTQRDAKRAAKVAALVAMNDEGA